MAYNNLVIAICSHCSLQLNQNIIEKEYYHQNKALCYQYIWVVLMNFIIIRV